MSEEERQFRNYLQMLVEQGAFITPTLQEKSTQFGLTATNADTLTLTHLERASELLLQRSIGHYAGCNQCFKDYLCDYMINLLVSRFRVELRIDSKKVEEQQKKQAMRFGMVADTFIEVEMTHGGKRYKGIVVQVKDDAL